MVRKFDNIQGLATVAPVPTVQDILDNSSFVGLSDNNTLVSFAPENPAQTSTIEVTGVTGVLLGVDTRPAKRFSLRSRYC